ncbi:MAG TPA: tetratricopeptide repeat protein [Beijerinckiaceae bacterium]|nr:tetratricopeptide repeat protein [Beijerinckiaceae bacterium]
MSRKSVGPTGATKMDALIATALAHHQAGRFDQAQALYERIVAFEPAHPTALANLAMLHQQRLAFTEAERWYARALAVKRTPEILSNLSVLRRAQGDLAGAERLLIEALALDPGRTDTLYNLGLTRMDAGKPAEAVAPLLQATCDPNASPDVFANLARVYLSIGRRDEALRHGEETLRRKDRHARASFAARGLRPLEPVAAPRFDPTRPQHNIIAFSLWGTKATYVGGAIANAELARALYPGWTCRIYADPTVPQTALDRMRKAGAQIAMMPLADRHYGLFWRFFAADDPQVHYFLCRDADSRLNSQEVEATKAWLESGKAFHVMRDAPFHMELMLAGLWGGVGGRLRGIREWIDRFYRSTEHRWIDQDFLRLEVWPRIREEVLIHDSHHTLFGARPFPPEGRLTAPNHVGAGHLLPEKEEGGREAP